MSSIIHIELPRNIKDQDLVFFKPLSYELNDLKILELKNIFLTHGGIAWKGFGIIKETTYGHPDVRAKQYKETLKTFISSRVLKSWPYDKLSEASYLSIFHPWCNYYHFLMDMFTRVLSVKDKLNELTLILPSYFSQYHYVGELLNTFKFKNIYLLNDNKHAQIENLVIPELRANSKKYNPKTLEHIREHLFSYYNLSQNIKPTRRIFITRQNASHRRIVNWSEVRDILLKNNFEIIDVGNKTVKEQIELMQSVDTVISVHGAALTNILFLAKNSKVVELMPKPPKGNVVNPLYWYLASIRNLDYYYFFYEISNFDILLKEDMHIDCYELSNILKKL
jgi:capsular polysaccharide biosynthesis protein